MNRLERPVLVTGASGFIGRHLVEGLLARGTAIIALSRPWSVFPKHWKDTIERVDLDRFSVRNIAAALGGRQFDCLFHLAAYGVVPNDCDR